MPDHRRRMTTLCEAGVDFRRVLEIASLSVGGCPPSLSVYAMNAKRKAPNRTYVYSGGRFQSEAPDLMATLGYPPPPGFREHFTARRLSTYVPLVALERNSPSRVHTLRTAERKTFVDCYYNEFQQRPPPCGAGTRDDSALFRAMTLPSRLVITT